jgi:hypothetical protein
MIRTIGRPGRRTVRLVAGGVAAALAMGVAVVGVSEYRTEQRLRGLRAEAVGRAAKAGPARLDAAAVAALPAPVRRWVAFTFPSGARSVAWVRIGMQGKFRLPLKQSFSPTTAEQTSAVRTPAFVFSARAVPFPGFWARAYDSFGDNRMEMKAKLLSTVTVVDQPPTAELNRISLRRWLIEAPLYPEAMLPGGPVRWQPVDDHRARAIVSAGGLEATLVATFGPDGGLARFDAEEEGDLTTPYHGSGEQAVRADYRLESGVMIPHGFTLSRVAGGKTYPFWTGRLTSITFG